MTKVTLTMALLQQLLHHAQHDAPQEACGLVGGVDTIAQIVLPIPNVDTEPTIRYTMDRRSMVEAIFQLRRHGLDVIAVYHSHPTEAAIPSATDIAEATWSDAIYIIIGNHGSEVRAWQLAHGEAREVLLETVL